MRARRGLGCVYTRLENALARKREMQRTINRCHDCIHDVGSHGPVLTTRMACARSARARMRVHASENALARNRGFLLKRGFLSCFLNHKRDWQRIGAILHNHKHSTYTRHPPAPSCSIGNGIPHWFYLDDKNLDPVPCLL